MERSGFEPRISGFEFDCPTIELSKLFDLLNCLDFPKSKTNIIFNFLILFILRPKLILFKFYLSDHKLRLVLELLV